MLQTLVYFQLISCKLVSFLFLAAFDYLMNHTDENTNIAEFENSSGVGVSVSPEEIERVVEKVVAAKKNELLEKRYSFNVGLLMGKYKSLICYPLLSIF